MKTEIVIIVKKPGRQPKAHLLGTVKTRHLEDFRREFTRSIAQTRTNRKIRARMKRAKKYKRHKSFRDFLRNLLNNHRRRIDSAVNYIVGTPSAAEIEYIGLEDGQ